MTFSRSLRLLAFTVALTIAASAQSTVAEHRSLALRHGINTGMWFAQAPGRYSVQRLRAFTTPDDLALIHQLGFDHIRLSIDPVPLTGWQTNDPDGLAFMAELDRVVHTALDRHLAVIVDIHPEDTYKSALLDANDPKGTNVKAFLSLWKALAAHYASLDTERVFFEIMNEPEQTDPYRWQGIQAHVVAQIRSVAPANTILVSGDHWDGMNDLFQIEPLADPNLIYTFHDYEPFAFTHEGATWTMDQVKPLRQVPYPSTPENIAANLAQEPDDHSKAFVQQYGDARWNAAKVQADIDRVAAWSAAHHVPIYCGEFGVHRPYADPAARDRWLHDMRIAFARDNIGWAMWDYQTNFGVVTKHAGTTTPDAGVVEALGLTASK